MGTASPVDTEVIFNETLGIIVSGEFDLHGMFSRELAPIPTSLLICDQPLQNENSKNYLQVEESSQTDETPDWIGGWWCNIVDNQLADIWYAT